MVHSVSIAIGSSHSLDPTFGLPTCLAMSIYSDNNAQRHLLKSELVVGRRLETWHWWVHGHAFLITRNILDTLQKNTLQATSAYTL